MTELWAEEQSGLDAPLDPAKAALPVRASLSAARVPPRCRR